jgi:hypothetical protein
VKPKKIPTLDAVYGILEIPPLCRKGWFKTFPFNKWSDNPALYDKLLVGKPVIAAFLGISEKTLKRWFLKYPDLPVIRQQYRCFAMTNDLMLWKIAQDLDRLPQSQLEAVRARMIFEKAERMGVTQKHYVATYVTQSRYSLETPVSHIRIRRTGHYRKTVDKALKLLRLFHELSHDNPDSKVW